jgi:NAD dependent epimerase/dehydratase family enzyme
MADELLLSSARVIPARLRESGFSFLHPELESSLRHMLGRQAPAR